MTKKPGLLFVVNDFNVGGAELFVLRLGKALSSVYRIYILDIYPDQSNLDFKRNFEENGFTFIERYTPLSKMRETIYWKLNSLYQLMGKKGQFSILKKKYQENQLQRFIDQEDIRLIHSHYYSSDCFTRNFLKKKYRKWVITMHGGYNQRVYMNLSEQDRASFLENARKNIDACDAMTYVADVNLEILEEIRTTPKQMKKIRLGLELDRNLIQSADTKKSIFTYCMVARADREKGWEIAVEAFQSLHAKHPDTRLIVVGPIEGVILELFEKQKENTSITFTDYTNQPSEFIRQSDVCLLPTYFEGESSPYSVIEYLSCGKPVISTNKGEIPDMLNVDGHKAGLLIDLNNEGIPEVNDLVNAMEKLLVDRNLYAELSGLTNTAFSKFTMERCKNEYIKLYNKLECAE